MVKKATHFTPEVLLSTPRRSTGKPSPCGRYILHTLSSYDFVRHERTTEIRVLDHAKGHSHLVVGHSAGSEAVWLPGDKILYLRDQVGDTGRTEFVQTAIDGACHTVVATIEGKVSDIKVKALSNGELSFLCWGDADSDGNLVNEKCVEKPAHTSMLFDSLFVRHWDKYKTRFHHTIFYGILKPSWPHTWVLKSFDNVLQGTQLQCPIDPYPSSDFYDLSETGIVFVAKDPTLNVAIHTKSDLYFQPLATDSLISTFGQQEPVMIATNDLAGAATCPCFSPDGRAAAFLKQTEDGYEADQNKVVIVPEIAGYLNSSSEHRGSSHRTIDLLRVDAAAGVWDISPSKLCFAHDSKSMFLIAEQDGYAKLWSLNLQSAVCEALTQDGSVLDCCVLASPNHLFLSGSSFIDNSFYAFIDSSSRDSFHLVSSHSRHGEAYGLQKEQVTSFWYTGKDTDVHALMIVPPGFDFNAGDKKYPLALLIHGGPQSAWLDKWSTRWNPAVWAAQGYVTIMPNITGSTGYGQGFVDAISGDWGGAPYQDLVKLMDHISTEMPFVDLDRAIAAGASYGGYMTNWIQGQDLGRKFKALVTHDGIFNSFGAQMSGDELWFPFNDFGGPPWSQEARKEWYRWDPSAHTRNWCTPQLIIHNGKDYRLDIAEGLAAFNVLQARGVPSRFLTSPEENHWTLNEENSLVWHTVVLNWVNKYAGLPLYKEDERSVILPNEPFP